MSKARLVRGLRQKAAVKQLKDRRVNSVVGLH